LKKLMKHARQLIWTLLVLIVLVFALQFVDLLDVLKQREFIKGTILIGLSVASLGILAYLQHRYINRPLVQIEEQMEVIDVDINPDYYLSIPKGSPLKTMVEKLNAILSKTYTMVREIQNDKEELHALNEELEASFGQLVAMEQEVTKQKLNFEALFRNAHEAIAMFDHEHNVIDCNKPFVSMFGYSLFEMLGKNLDNFISDPNHIGDAKVLTVQVFDGRQVLSEGVRYNKHGDSVEVAIQGVPMLIDGHVIGGYAIYTDISERKRNERHLAHISTHDYLTDLLNRNHFDSIMNKFYRGERQMLGFVMIDINNLKLVNDAFGHVVGDMVLVEVANRITQSASQAFENCREVDGCIIGRLGSDEFGVLIPDSSKVVLENFVEVLKVKCANIRLGEVEISVAYGWSEIDNTIDTLKSLLKNTEDNMNRNKLIESPSVRAKAVYAIVNTLHEKNKREEAHSRRVGSLSYQLGQHLGVSSRELDELKSMGLLHDIGKIAIDDHILNKPDRLDEEEYTEIKKHPEIGYRILSSVNELSEMAEYVLCHHEAYDGKGYPRGLKGEEIPYLSRIIAVTDAYDAMTRDRSYRKAMTQKEAGEELNRCAGTQFDPHIVEVFLKNMETLDDITI